MVAKKLSSTKYRHNSSVSRCVESSEGFTFIELIVTLAVLSIVLAIAMPLIDTKSSQVLHYAREFKAALSYARGEAVNRSRPVIVCASTNPEADSPACADEDTWHSGWIIYYVNMNTAGDSESVILRRHQALEGDITVNVTEPLAAVGSLAFTAQGYSNEDDLVEFEFCTASNVTAGRTIAVATGGRAMRLQGRTDCSS
jgi:type IV fimbrial biogenesis protein FimT